jgi:hypothetical protein
MKSELSRIDLPCPGRCPAAAATTCGNRPKYRLPFFTAHEGVTSGVPT